MPFSTDRDLLAVEPQVFNDVPLAAQQRLKVSDGELTGNTLTSASADFAGAAVEIGSIVLINALPHEVIECTDAHTLTVSLLRTRINDPVIASSLAGQSDLEIIVRTFAPQAALVHDMLLRLVGIDPDDPVAPLTEDAIVSTSVMVRLEVLGTLERVYTAATNLIDDDKALWQKASHFRERFTAGCRRAAVLIDTDGDGRADTERRPGVVNLVRI